MRSNAGMANTPRDVDLQKSKFPPLARWLVGVSAVTVKLLSANTEVRCGESLLLVTEVLSALCSCSRAKE